jgi:hypothetical protein
MTTKGYDVPISTSTDGPYIAPEATTIGFIPFLTVDSNLGFETISSQCTTSTMISLMDSNDGFVNELSQCAYSTAL